MSEASGRLSGQNKRNKCLFVWAFMTLLSCHIDMGYGWHPGIRMSIHPKKISFGGNLETQHAGLPNGPSQRWREEGGLRWINHVSAETEVVWHRQIQLNEWFWVCMRDSNWPRGGKEAEGVKVQQTQLTVSYISLPAKWPQSKKKWVRQQVHSH